MSASLLAPSVPDAGIGGPVVPQHELSSEARLRRTLEAADADVLVENAFTIVGAQLDGTERRALARRLSHYRPGSGDDIAARFVRLDRSVRMRILGTLEMERVATPLPEAIRGDLEIATGRSLAHVKVHDGPEGHAIAAAHGGARGVAIGSEIFLAEGALDPISAEGRELLAHEVAHVVQAEVGTDSVFERSSDNVIESAEEEADDFATRFRVDGAGARFTPTVAVAGPMRKASGTKPGKSQSHADFVGEYLTRILAAIELRVGRLPAPHPRLRWSGTSGAAVFARVKAVTEIKPERAMLELAKLVAPADLWGIVDRARRGPGNTKLEVLRLETAAAFEAALLAALPRMGMRAVVQWDRVRGAPDAEDVVASSPLDLLLAGVLVDKAAVTWTAHKSGAPGDTEAKAFRDGTRRVTFEYVGSKDANLWNWIKVTSPDATAEDVAATPLGSKVPALGSEQAYRFAVSPPYFGVPVEAARHIDEFSRHMTVETLVAVRREAAQDNRPIVDLADRRALRDSKVADDAARMQAPRAPGQLDPARALRHVRAQADAIATLVAPYRYRDVAAPALHFIERREREATDPAKLAAWAGTLEAQERILIETEAELRAIIEPLRLAIEKQAKRLGVKSADVPLQAPIRELLIAYARAAGHSHLHAEAPALLAEARRLRGQLALSQAEDTIRKAREAGLAVDEAIAGQRMPDGSSEPHADESAVALQTLTFRDQQLRGKVARGERIDKVEVEDLQLDASETELRGRLAALSTNLRDLKREAESLGLTHKRFGFFSVAQACDVMLLKINGSTEAQRSVDKNDTTKGGWHATLDAASKLTIASQRRHARGKAIGEVTADLDTFRTQVDLKNFFDGAYKEIENERVRRLINSVLLQIGLAVVTGEVIGAVGIAIRGIGIAGEIGAEIRNASLAWHAGAVIAQAGANTAINGAMGGPISARTFAENGLAIILTSAAIKPFMHLLADTATVEGQIVQIARWGRTTGWKAAAELVIETGAGIAAAGVAHAVTHGGQMGAQDAEAWVTTGLSIAATRYVGERTKGLKERVATAARELGPRTAPKFEALEKRAIELETLAETINQRDPKSTKPATPEEALALLRKHHELVKAEHELYNDHPQDKRRKANRVDADADSQLLDAALQLAHLTPVIHGKHYEGSAKHIEDAFRAAEEIGVPFKRERIAGRDAWRVTSGGKTVEIHELSPRGPRSASPRNPTPVNAAKIAGSVETRAELVPGSTFRGRAGDAKLDLAIARSTLDQVLRDWPGVKAVRKIDVDGGSKDVQVRQSQTLLVELAAKGGEQPRSLTIRVDIGPLEGQTVARSWVNSTQQGFSQIDKRSVRVLGRHVIHVSERVDRIHLERALAHEVAEIFEIDRLNSAGRYATPDALRPGASGTELSPHDRGRLAEIDVLARSSNAGASIELHALIEHLGLRQGSPGAEHRWQLATKHLSKQANERMGAQRREPGDGPARRDLEKLRLRAHLEQRVEERQARDNADVGHHMPSLTGSDGKPLAGAALAKRAEVARVRRDARSKSTWAELKNLQADHTGFPALPYHVMIGGGASLAGRDHHHLLVDDRGRWQADGNAELAQTGNQLKHTADAKLGDPRQHVAPNERLPLDAVRAWQDEIAAQGPVIDGRANLKFGRNGELLIDLLVAGDTRTFRLTSEPIIATGFVPERVPGAPFNLRPSEAASALHSALIAARGNASLGAHIQVEAAQALVKLDSSSIITNHDTVRFLDIVSPNLRTALETVPAVKQALGFGEATKNWEQMIAKDDAANPHVFFGDQANLGRDQALRSNNWVIAGMGGTGVSAAELVLKNNPQAKVVMVGTDSPAGLLENDQFRMLAEAHAEPALAASMGITKPTSGRLSLREGRVAVPRTPEKADRSTLVDESNIDPKLRSKHVYDVNGTSQQTKQPVHAEGTAYVAALGRNNDYPPAVLELIAQIRAVPKGEYWIQPLFHDDQYIGYRVRFTIGKDTVSSLDVTGAASRFLPLQDARTHADTTKITKAGKTVERTFELLQASDQWDAPAESGNFSGGFAATATQTARYARHQNAAKEGK